jgi:hypothetical protein
MRFQKRHKAWNKGLTKEIDNRLKLSGKRGSKTKKKLYAEGKIIHWTKLENYKEKFKNGEIKIWNKGIKQWEGKKHPMLGRTMSKEAKEKISKFHSGKHYSPETEFKGGHHYNIGKHSKNEFTKERWSDIRFKEKIIKSMQEKWKDPEYRAKRMKIIEKKWADPKQREKMIANIKKRWSNPEFREKRCKEIKELWTKSEYREKVIRNSLKGRFKRPTSLERKMIEIIEKNNLPYKYVGNGSFLIGYRSPDFVNINGEKICIETRPKKMCPIWNSCSPDEYEKRRKEHYSKFGWNCIVVWEEDFDNENMILEKIKVG